MADKKPNIGQLDSRIEIQSSTPSRSSTGQEILEWSCFAQCWAAVGYPLTGSGEKVLGDQVVATTSAEFYIRYRDGINEKMRILYSGKYYNILIIREIGRKEYLSLSAQVQE